MDVSEEKKYDYYVDMDSFSVQATTYEKARLEAERYLKEGNYDAIHSIDGVGVLDDHEHKLDENEICVICGAWIKK